MATRRGQLGGRERRPPNHIYAAGAPTPELVSGGVRAVFLPQHVQVNHFIQSEGKNVYDGCQSWETSFIVQAYCSTDLVNEFSQTLIKAHEFIKMSQVLENTPDNEAYYRHRSKGSWTLSTADNGWCVSDCTAEALKALLMLSKISPDLAGDAINGERLYDAVDGMLSFMNKDGTFSTYECERTTHWLEVIKVINQVHPSYLNHVKMLI
ncbi:Os05g0237700 [Oryza sativa Japonica Group]|uniref:Os05g0237700 protein n=1 Tax=Oryza sativa subsp. japonica TaxID=39947 RepID=Q0DJR6_ORYSJ|nr:Os05g0237700 [Oryza sativa Japonica Group]|eukprot:NP_001054993.2 Os05g0237700 [Oryza sativa Japonica Group]